MRRAAALLAWLAAAAVLPAALVVARGACGDADRWLFEARLFYWAMPVVVGAALAAAFVRWRAATTTVRDAAARWWPGLVAAVALAGVVVLVVPPTMRVQFDETSLVNVSQNMHLQRAAAMTTGSIPFEGTVLRLENTIDKRPPLFPFLVSLLHDVTGCRVANAFALNALLLAAALFLAFAAVRERLGLTAALAAPLLLLAVPLLAVCATSAGFDLLATVLFATVLLAARDFVERPDGVRCVLLVTLGTLFAYARYESVLACAVVGGLVLWFVRGRWTLTVPARAALAAVPGLLTPLLFLLQIARSPNFYPEARGEPLVAWRHGIEHIGPFLAAWFLPSLANPLPGALASVAVVAWLARLLHRRGSRGDLLAVLPVLTTTTAALFWFFGDVRDPVALRLFLPCAAFTALSPLLLVATFGRRFAPWLLGGAALVCGLRIHQVQRGAVFPVLDGAHLLHAVEDAIANIGADPRTTLWVTTAAQHLATVDLAALSPRSFAARASEIQQLIAGGHVRAIHVLTTPRDADLAGGFGDPQEVVARGAAIVARTGGDVPITVYRLR